MRYAAISRVYATALIELALEKDEFEGLGQDLRERGLLMAQENIVSKKKGEWLIANEGPCMEKCIPQSLWLWLVDIAYFCKGRNASYLYGLLVSAHILQPLLLAEASGEMVLDYPSAQASHDHYLGDAAVGRLLHHMLDGWLDAYGQHLLWDDLCCRQKTWANAPCSYDSLHVDPGMQYWILMFMLCFTPFDFLRTSHKIPPQSPYVLYSKTIHSNMRIVSVVGARPQFIKSAPVTKAVREGGHEEILVHTGQHYDKNMSDAFFEELNIPEPDINLGVGSSSHARQTARMLEGLEEVIREHKPDGVLIYGDTNSTLAGALAAVKMHIPVAHVEAGLRSFNRRMPEEINRVVADHVSNILFAPTKTALDNLKNEGITKGVYKVGDTMMDALLDALERVDKITLLESKGLEDNGYFLSTMHRAENTDDPERLKALFDALDHAPLPVILPIHPRTKKALINNGLEPTGSLRLIKPIGHMEFVGLLANARAILTDSGGVQKEAYMVGTPCITLRDETEWVETVEAGWNRVVGVDTEKIKESMDSFHPTSERPPFYGDGKAALEILDILEKEWG